MQPERSKGRRGWKGGGGGGGEQCSYSVLCAGLCRLGLTSSGLFLCRRDASVVASDSLAVHM